ncbi:maltooligosyl trehalose synthase [Actinoplanes sp. SE50]|uniref:malto-oligosyltrehalose synthase n=1 Tax=unclassified Actinoplanes TaxID=2626549 RepID=UPI00023EC181|nr:MULTISPECIES: malto-oligosyltrehalose synthase [unclassified Actinoplanes]AEV87504.1 (1->4)-alpha-D-glucan 1-alpha-D-glucosylmutase [Actinoplanes sp. SE50/110]ATO85907.1 maltooligosyl trehalose synthase [Actinoplanes sp. SE50]SLM03321.1 malto-oligosyltrehalose synthase [Actinoplanes sp. SE50/110]
MRPSSTYRVQVRPDFPLKATAEIADYLADLGVSHLYSAPLLTASPGSEHGYDVVDHTQVSPELGGADGLRALSAALKNAGLGLVVDIVPNHAGVAVAKANPTWWDVLKRGRESAYAKFYDIDWERGKILLPVLAADPGALDELKVEGDELVYYDKRYPIADGTGGGTPREVHDRQHYELADWTRGDSEINYRRFFAITELAGLRVEDPEVFEATHAEILRWVREGLVDGIRVDHPDGLRDPAGYLQRLHDAAPEAWLVIEKILEPGEPLPRWPVAGTTGYDAMAEVNGVFVDTGTEAFFDTLDHHLTGATVTFQNLTHDTKHHVATRLLAAELARLARLVPEVEAAPRGLAELAACFPVYRSYLPGGARHLAQARAEAGRRRPQMISTLDRLTGRLRNPADELAIRFQQFTGAVMAKGVEDTGFYRWTRFVARNEVGNDPTRFGVSTDEFHECSGARQQDWPDTMTSLSTHDTKRGEDVRARLAVLSELPGDWTEVVRRWVRLAPLPDPALAHLIWQVTVGAWPLSKDRLLAYAVKAAREAATSTTWQQPDEPFETALREMVDRIYDDPDLHREVTDFAASITPPGWSNSLGQKLVQLTMPGVPDVYQGTELWDYSLVDPDNRRPVDFAARRELLGRLDDGWQPPVDETGAAKLLVVSRTLRLLRRRPELFRSYRPVFAEGRLGEHVLAFDRGGVVAVATRLPVGLSRHGGWHDTTLSLDGHSWTEVFTNTSYGGNRLAVADLLQTYPVALLVKE